MAVTTLDQLSKQAVRSSIAPGEERRVLPGVQFVDTRNHGVAFGLLPGHHLAVAAVIALALIALLAYFARHATRPLIWLPTGMLIGGALGNVLDRLRQGSVTDFVKLPLGWPPFNLADASITLGVLILVLVIERRPADGRPPRTELPPGTQRPLRGAEPPAAEPPLPGGPPARPSAEPPSKR